MSGTRNKKTERNIGIVVDRAMGITYREIAEKNEISIKRARQIVEHHAWEFMELEGLYRANFISEWVTYAGMDPIPFTENPLRPSGKSK